MKLKLLSAIVLLACNVSFGQKQIAWLEGSWIGDGHQPNALTHQNWSIQLDCEAGSNVKIAYPTFPCGGNWELVKSTGKKAVFMERITVGTDKCANNLKVVVKKKGKDKIQVAYIVPETGTVDATGILKRK